MQNSYQQAQYRTISPHDIAFPPLTVDLPLVLDSDTILKSGEHTLTPSEFKQLYCGTFDEGNPLRIAFAIERPKSSELHPIATFDIDSIMAIPNSLAVARQGLKVFFYPPRHLNIQKDLHLYLPIVNPLSNRTKNVPICKIPHILLGQVFGFSELNLYLFFPQLYSPVKKTNFLTDSHLERFYHKLFLPALYATCPPDITQRLPASMQKAKMDSNSRSKENRSRNTKTFGSMQYLSYLIAPQYLAGIWSFIEIHCSDSGIQDFGGLFLFLDGKDYKSITRQNSPELCYQMFLDQLMLSCDNRYLNPDSTWLDYGKEVVNNSTQLSPLIFDSQFSSDNPPITYLWRQCCLQSYVKQVEEFGKEKSFRHTIYPWALTNDTCNMSMTPTIHSELRNAGLLYSQFYSITHESFKAGGTYPFDNVALEGLAVDSELASSWLNVGGGSKWDMKCVRNAYIASKNRCRMAILSDCGKSFGIREEHRVSLTLLSKIRSELQSMNFEEMTTPIHQNQRPFWVQNTPDTMLFLQNNINKYAYAFEFTLSQTPNNSMISWEHTRFMVMLLRVLRLSYGGGLLNKEAGLWHDEKKGGIWGDLGMEGMGFQYSLEKRGYAWLPADKINWVHCTFNQIHSVKIPFNNNSLLGSYRKRMSSVQSITDVYKQFTALLNSLVKHYKDKVYFYYTLKYLSTKCIISYQQEIWTRTKDDWSGENLNECLSGHVGMSVEGLKKRAVGGVEPYFATSTNKYKLSPLGQTDYLWGFCDGKKRDNWDNKPYRLLFRQVFTFLETEFSEKFAIHWSTHHYKQFLFNNWILPQPVKSRFYQTIMTKSNGRQRIWYSTVQLPLSQKRTFGGLITEGSGMEGFFQPGEPSHLPMENIDCNTYLELSAGEAVNHNVLKNLVKLGAFE